MALRIGGMAEPFRELGKLQMHAAALLERDACLEKAARLSPKLGLRAQAPESRQQLRVALALE